ncbi:MAG: 3-ketoacyl-ACP reductase [Pseudomonadota bacterium]|jgi:3-oxoacyl-[acyl-carrier protein] reductase
MFDLTEKVAIVTGGSRGIGRACAVALAAQGAEVIITYAGNEAAAKETVALIEAGGGRGEAVCFDVGNMAETEAAITEIGKRKGRLDILVANAGISLDGLLLRLKEEDLDRTLAVNLKGTIACAKAAIKPMMRMKSGRIILLSSVVGETGNAGQTSYAASKAALLGVCKSLAREYASRNITVNAITPGYIATDMTSALTEEQRQAMLTGVPLGRPGTSEEIGAAVAYLASDEAAYITGQTLRLNGGMYM